MNKYCQKCQSVYSAILGKCPKCRSGYCIYDSHDYGLGNYALLPKRERIYLADKYTSSMDPVTRIERAENELRLAKLELIDSPTKIAVDEIKSMLLSMNLSDGSYIIVEPTSEHVKVILNEGYYFLSRSLTINWNANCSVSGGNLTIDFRRKNTIHF